jgi:hypothetical protein
VFLFKENLVVMALFDEAQDGFGLENKIDGFGIENRMTVRKR